MNLIWRWKLLEWRSLSGDWKPLGKAQINSNSSKSSSSRDTVIQSPLRSVNWSERWTSSRVGTAWWTCRIDGNVIIIQFQYLCVCLLTGRSWREFKQPGASSLQSTPGGRRHRRRRFVCSRTFSLIFFLIFWFFFDLKSLVVAASN